MEDALYSQTTPFTLADGSKTNLTAISNIDRVRTRGAELAVQKANLLGNRLDLTGNLTYADALTLRDAANPDGDIAIEYTGLRARSTRAYRNGAPPQWQHTDRSRRRPWCWAFGTADVSTIRSPTRT